METAGKMGMKLAVTISVMWAEGQVISARPLSPAAAPSVLHTL
jgi:hypothetical protein